LHTAETASWLSLRDNDKSANYAPHYVRNLFSIIWFTRRYPEWNMDFSLPSASVLTSLQCHVNNIDVSSHFFGCDSTHALVWPLVAA
jgi:hypothetical protein